MSKRNNARILLALAKEFAEKPPKHGLEVLNALERVVREQAGEESNAQPKHGEKVKPRRAEKSKITAQPNPVAIVRRKREKQGSWKSHDSWLGGLPTLGMQEWPKGRSGVPFNQLARIDLREIAEERPDLPLPKSGSLSFFIGDIDNGGEGAVLYSPPEVVAETPIPAHLPAAYEEGAYALPGERNRLTRQVFPYWPVEPIPLDLPAGFCKPSRSYEESQSILDGQLAALHEKVPPRVKGLGIAIREEENIDGGDRVWWYGVFHVAARLSMGAMHLPSVCKSAAEGLARSQKFLDNLDPAKSNYAKKVEIWERDIARNTKYLEKLLLTHEKLKSFAPEFEGFLADRQPWQELTNDEISSLESYIEVIREDFSLVYRGNTPFSVGSLCGLSIRHLFTQQNELFAILPDGVIDYVNHAYRLPFMHCHQMFGLGANIQEAPERHLGDHLLLQITYDEMTEMTFGDVGVIQFWIDPDDLVNERWDAVVVTFEGH